MTRRTAMTTTIPAGKSRPVVYDNDDENDCSTNNSCPSHILSFLENLESGDEVMPIIHVHAAKSAQQSVWILQYEKQNKSSNDSSSSVFSVENDNQQKEEQETSSFLEWKKRLRLMLDKGEGNSGNKNRRLVVRQWKGASKWWNLNRNNNNKKTTGTGGDCSSSSNNGHQRNNFAAAVDDDAVQELARSEIAGYRIARMAAAAAAAAAASSDDMNLVIPSVLYANNSNCDDDDDPPWAIFEYVGRHNPHIFSPPQHNNNASFDDSWTRSMIVVREEFGFSEPHPRWGRVPVDQSLTYATTVLMEVVVPLHESFRQLQRESSSNAEFQESLRDLSGYKRDSNGQESGYTFDGMVLLYKAAWNEMNSSLNHTINFHSTAANNEDARLRHAIQLLGQCIDRLELETSIQPQPPVLVHMDLQPQNLLFARRNNNNSLHVSSVLDWEEAAFADPRFELLLLGRKVCANKQQAIAIWNLYQAKSNKIELGPLDPWLRLETVHSLTTLLLQSMDLASGGRSPWESKPDLLGKVEREFGRLVAAGWTFCQDAAGATTTAT